MYFTLEQSAMTGTADVLHALHWSPHARIPKSLVGMSFVQRLAWMKSSKSPFERQPKIASRWIDSAGRFSKTLFGAEMSEILLRTSA